MSSLASVADLQKLMGRTFQAGVALDQAEMVLSIVSAWVRSIAGTAWDAPAVVPADVSGVVLSASRRELKNPDGVISRTKGPFAVAYNPPPVDFFTTGELAILHRFRPQSGAGGLRTISSSRGERGVRNAGRVRLGVNGAPWTIFLPGDLGWYTEYEDGWGEYYSW